MVFELRLSQEGCGVAAVGLCSSGDVPDAAQRSVLDPAADCALEPQVLEVAHLGEEGDKQPVAQPSDHGDRHLGGWAERDGGVVDRASCCVAQQEAVCKCTCRLSWHEPPADGAVLTRIPGSEHLVVRYFVLLSAVVVRCFGHLHGGWHLRRPCGVSIVGGQYCGEKRCNNDPEDRQQQRLHRIQQQLALLPLCNCGMSHGGSPLGTVVVCSAPKSALRQISGRTNRRHTLSQCTIYVKSGLVILESVRYSEWSFI